MIDAATLQLVLDEERVKFQRETLRTSELSQALQKLINIHREEHTKGPWSRGCWRCDAVAEAEELLAAPLPALKPMADVVMVPSTLLNDIRTIADRLGPVSPAPSDEGRVERIVKAFERVLLDINFAIEQGILPDIMNDMIYVEARAALAAIKEVK